MIQPTALNFIIFAAMFVLFSFLWQQTAQRVADRPTGGAMAYIFGG